MLHIALMTAILAALAFSIIHSGHLLRRYRMVHAGYLVGAFYFAFFPLIIRSGLRSIDPALPAFPEEPIAPLAILLLYILGSLLAVALPGRSIRSQVKRALLPGRERRVLLGAIIFYFVLQIYIMVASGVARGGHWYWTRIQFIMQEGAYISLLMMLLFAARFVIVGYSFELLSLRLIRFAAAAFVTIAVIGFEILYTGNRITTLMFGMAGFLYIYRKHGLRCLTITFALLLPMMLAFAAYQDVRHLLFEASSRGAFVSIWLDTMAKSDLRVTFAKIFESDDLVIALNLFGEVGSEIPPISGASLLRALAWLLPRSVWESKPLPVTVTIGDHYLPGVGVALIPLLWGEWHLNFGITGILLFPIFLRGMLNVLDYLARNVPLNAYLRFLFGFLLMRLPLAETITIAVLVIIITKGLGFLLGDLLPQKPGLTSKPKA